jgi:hypothetical protein
MEREIGSHFLFQNVTPQAKQPRVFQASREPLLSLRMADFGLHRVQSNLTHGGQTLRRLPWQRLL